MIRPFTCVCLLLAAGAGLYTYEAKHQAEMLDQKITQTLKRADATRQRIGVLRAEYALLNDPQRLAELTAAHLPDLRSTTPQQFTTLAELDRRLPAIGLPPTPPPPIAEPDAVEPADPAPPTIPMASATPSQPAATAAPPARLASAGTPLPLQPPVAAGSVTANKPALTRPKPQRPALLAADSHAKPAAPHFAATRLPGADAFVTPVAAPSEQMARLTQMGVGGGVGRSGLGGGGGGTVSALGMAHSGGLLYPAALPAR